MKKNQLFMIHFCFKQQKFLNNNKKKTTKTDFNSKFENFNTINSLDSKLKEFFQSEIEFQFKLKATQISISHN